MKPSDSYPADASPDFISRRRAIRLAAPPGLTVTLSDRRIRTHLVDISQRGAGLLTDFPLSHGVTYVLTFRIGTRVASCTARATHVHKLPAAGWRAGVAFVEGDQLRRIEQIVDELIDGLVQFS